MVLDKFPTDIELYRIMTTRLSEIHENDKKQELQKIYVEVGWEKCYNC